MFEAIITIQLKEGISDPEGANTLKALKLLGFDSVKEAKMAKTLHLLIDEKKKDIVEKNVEEMCQRLLTNPVIHQYEIKLMKK